MNKKDILNAEACFTIDDNTLLIKLDVKEDDKQKSYLYEVIKENTSEYTPDKKYRMGKYLITFEEEDIAILLYAIPFDCGDEARVEVQHIYDSGLDYNSPEINELDLAEPKLYSHACDIINN